MMKNIQIINGAENCSYSIFAATDDEFDFIFPGDGQDVEFIEDVIERAGDEKAGEVMAPVWKRPVDKPNANGIHGTSFYELNWKKKFYPTKRESEMELALGS